MSDGDRKAALTIALVMGSSGALLLIVADASHDAGARSAAGAVAYGLPLAAAPFVALLAGSWSRVRVNVEPAGLSRSRRILSLAPMLMVLGAIVGSAVLLGSGNVLPGIGTLAAASAAFASFLSDQIAARPPRASRRHDERDEYDLRRTPGIAGLGAMASLYGLVVGASTESLMQGVLWASFPLAITLLGIYGAAAPYLAFRGTPSAIVFLCAAPATLVSSVASDNPAGALIAFNGAALATTIVVTRKLERDRRAALASLTSEPPADNPAVQGGVG